MLTLTLTLAWCWGKLHVVETGLTLAVAALGEMPSFLWSCSELVRKMRSSNAACACGYQLILKRRAHEQVSTLTGFICSRLGGNKCLVFLVSFLLVCQFHFQQGNLSRKNLAFFPSTQANKSCQGENLFVWMTLYLQGKSHRIAAVC